MFRRRRLEVIEKANRDQLGRRCSQLGKLHAHRTVRTRGSVDSPEQGDRDPGLSTACQSMRCAATSVVREGTPEPLSLTLPGVISIRIGAIHAALSIRHNVIKCRKMQETAYQRIAQGGLLERVFRTHGLVLQCWADKDELVHGGVRRR